MTFYRLFYAAYLFEYDIRQGMRGFDLVKHQHIDSKWRDYRIEFIEDKILIHDMVTFSTYPMPEDRMKTETFLNFKEAMKFLSEIM